MVLVGDDEVQEEEDEEVIEAGGEGGSQGVAEKEQETRGEDCRGR